MKEFDYIIIGGGCAGLSLAYELQIHEKLENNIGVDWSFGNKEKTKEIFSNSKYNVKIFNQTIDRVKNYFR